MSCLGGLTHRVEVDKWHAFCKALADGDAAVGAEGWQNTAQQLLEMCHCVTQPCCIPCHSIKLWLRRLSLLEQTQIVNAALETHLSNARQSVLIMHEWLC